MSDRRSSSSLKPAIHYRGSSSDSRTSYDSRSSTTDGYYSSSRSTMSTDSRGSGYSKEQSREHRYRVPDNGLSHTISAPTYRLANSSPTADRKYVTSTISRSGKVCVTNHGQSGYEKYAPRIDDASSGHYQDAKNRSSKYKAREHGIYK